MKSSHDPKTDPTNKIKNVSIDQSSTFLELSTESFMEEIKPIVTGKKYLKIEKILNIILPFSDKQDPIAGKKSIKLNSNSPPKNESFRLIP